MQSSAAKSDAGKGKKGKKKSSAPALAGSTSVNPVAAKEMNMPEVIGSQISQVDSNADPKAAAAAGSDAVVQETSPPPVPSAESSEEIRASNSSDADHHVVESSSSSSSGFRHQVQSSASTMMADPHSLDWFPMGVSDESIKIFLSDTSRYLLELMDNSLDNRQESLTVVVSLSSANGPVLTIFDNGAGIARKTLNEAFLMGKHIGSSSEDIGNFGIGKISCLGLCDRERVSEMVFMTKAAEDALPTSVRFLLQNGRVYMNFSAESKDQVESTSSHFSKWIIPVSQSTLDSIDKSVIAERYVLFARKFPDITQSPTGVSISSFEQDLGLVQSDLAVFLGSLDSMALKLRFKFPQARGLICCSKKVKGAENVPSLMVFNNFVYLRNINLSFQELDLYGANRSIEMIDFINKNIKVIMLLENCKLGVDKASLAPTSKATLLNLFKSEKDIKGKISHWYLDKSETSVEEPLDIQIEGNEGRNLQLFRVIKGIKVRKGKKVTVHSAKLGQFLILEDAIGRIEKIFKVLMSNSSSFSFLDETIQIQLYDPILCKVLNIQVRDEPLEVFEILPDSSSLEDIFNRHDFPSALTLPDNVELDPETDTPVKLVFQLNGVENPVKDTIWKLIRIELVAAGQRRMFNNGSISIPAAGQSESTAVSLYIKKANDSVHEVVNRGPFEFQIKTRKPQEAPQSKVPDDETEDLGKSRRKRKTISRVGKEVRAEDLSEDDWMKIGQLMFMNIEDPAGFKESEESVQKRVCISNVDKYANEILEAKDAQDYAAVLAAMRKALDATELTQEQKVKLMEALFDKKP